MRGRDGLQALGSHQHTFLLVFCYALSFAVSMRYPQLFFEVHLARISLMCHVYEP